MKNVVGWGRLDYLLNYFRVDGKLRYGHLCHNAAGSRGTTESSHVHLW